MKKYVAILVFILISCGGESQVTVNNAQKADTIKVIASEVTNNNHSNDEYLAYDYKQCTTQKNCEAVCFENYTNCAGGGNRTSDNLCQNTLNVCKLHIAEQVKYSAYNNTRLSERWRWFWFGFGSMVIIVIISIALICIWNSEQDGIFILLPVPIMIAIVGIGMLSLQLNTLIKLY
jgi:hypothetical protein